MAKMSTGHPGVIAARNELNDRPTDLTTPDELDALKVVLYVWNPDELGYERMRQPMIAPLADDLPMDQRYQRWAGTTNIKYKSIHATHKALTSDTHWLNWKFTWEAVGDSYFLTRQEGPLEGSVDNIDNLGWA